MAFKKHPRRPPAMLHIHRPPRALDGDSLFLKPIFLKPMSATGAGFFSMRRLWRFAQLMGFREGLRSPRTATDIMAINTYN
ncbi:protein of unknown function [Methylocella tundrae]|uniref:Uncharacterized protein n=1 Tax=Methylocella tundrae TaxID=227605 RepID=A0A4U8Z3F8_METTU|nr:protein of unknown function [Methylocella tundrae]